MSKLVGPRSATGILKREQAIALADGFAEIYDDESFIVLEYNGIPATEFDVEVAHPNDRPGVTPHVIYRTT